MLPVTVIGKKLVQSLWKLDIGWDEVVSGDIKENWNNYVDSLSKIEICLKRKFKNYISPMLHVFCDASQSSYGAVAYFAEGEKINFVMAKSRLAPIKSPTLPQLELTAINIGAKLAKFIKESFSV